MMTRRAFVAGGGALLLSACEREEKYKYAPTPGGLPLAWQNVGSVPDWYSWDEIGTKLDGAVEDGVTYLAKYGAAPELVRALARAYKYVGYDMPRFAINASETGWASGAIHLAARTILLAFWGRAKGDVVPPDAPPWTVYSWPTRPSPAYDWGFEPPAFPALGHELGHAIWGAQFEHGWVPPVVSGSAQALRAAPPNWDGDCGVTA